jgi:hypothetical protein
MLYKDLTPGQKKLYDYLKEHDFLIDRPMNVNDLYTKVIELAEMFERYYDQAVKKK